MSTSNPSGGGKRASKRPSAFAFLEKRPYDMLVSIRLRESDRTQFNRLDLYYSERGRVSSFCYRASDPEYEGDQKNFLKGALSGILMEARSRLVAHDDFKIWYYDDNTRELVEAEMSRLSEADPTAKRFGNEVIKRSQVVGGK